MNEKFLFVLHKIGAILAFPFVVIGLIFFHIKRFFKHL